MNEPPPRALLIGTAQSIAQMRQALRAAGEPVRILGCIPIRLGDHSESPDVRELGELDRLETVLHAHRVPLALLSLPAAMDRLIDGIRTRLREQGVLCRLMPTVRDQLDGRLLGGTGATFDAASLLDRTARELDQHAISNTLGGKRVLITGAGGSIGSELARRVARYQPTELLLMDRSENGLFEIEREIAAEYPQLSRQALLHDVCDAPRTQTLCQRLRPQVIFHAAAHKHVPMMEDHPARALENNFFGTQAAADAAIACGAQRFVMISTDKAVHPSSVMGATKRLAELYVQHAARRGPTRFSAVRFGNVLGSACSVATIWRRQLAQGGPLTLTDPRMTRYFMTIPEAASLVIQAASLPQPACACEGDGAGTTEGRIFVLDMGEPIRILDLARRFIRLHGLEPQRDVRIRITGARPGEKLCEQLSYDSEPALATDHPAVRMLRTSTPPTQTVQQIIHLCEPLRQSEDRPRILQTLREAVPEMTPPPNPHDPFSGEQLSHGTEQVRSPLFLHEHACGP